MSLDISKVKILRFIYIYKYFETDTMI